MAAALAGLLIAAPAAAQTYSGSMEPCLAPHGDRDLYRAGLESTGWVDVSDAGREAALAMIADAFLPITAPALGLPWANVIATRADARAFWADLAQGRTIMAREARVLLLAGFLDDTGEMRVECWTAGPPDDVTQDFFVMAGQIVQSEGVELTALGIAAGDDHAETEILVSRLVPPEEPEPPLAATDGLRTTIIFVMPEVTP